MNALKSTLLCSLTAFAANALAAVPNTFEAGTPATAAAVNENFESADTRITTLESTTQATDQAVQSQESRIDALGSTTADIESNVQDLDNRVRSLENPDQSNDQTYLLSDYSQPRGTTLTYDRAREFVEEDVWDPELEQEITVFRQYDEVFSRQRLSNGDEIESSSYATENDTGSYSYLYGYGSGQYSETSTNNVIESELTITCNAVGGYSETQLNSNSSSPIRLGGTEAFAFKEELNITNRTCSYSDGQPDQIETDIIDRYWGLTQTTLTNITTFSENGFDFTDCIEISRTRSGESSSSDVYVRCRGVGTVKRIRVYGYRNGGTRIDTLTSITNNAE